jgi:uncharacterized NAD(P)/FAD-binding protein YdhS
MSAFPNEPGHFLAWLTAIEWPDASPDAFVPRKLYGDYIADVLQCAVQTNGSHAFRHIRREAVDAGAVDGKVWILLSDGATVVADKAVFALGNPASEPTGHVSTESLGEQWHESPWIGDALRVRFPGERMLLVGAGLTAVDCALAVHGQSLPCKTYMLSRRGLLPQAHDLHCAEGAPPVFEDASNIRLMLRQLRAQIGRLQGEDQCWRTAVDALRPISNKLWRGLPAEQRCRFLRHLKSYWEVHRHRMAPCVRDRLNELISRGDVEVISGRIRRTARVGGAIEFTIGRRGHGECRLTVDRAINCTGIQEDYRLRPRRIIRALIENGFATPHETGLGFRTGDSGELIDAAGCPSTNMFTLGPPRRGDLFETTAVPEIRRQAEELARRFIGSVAPARRVQCVGNTVFT